MEENKGLQSIKEKMPVDAKIYELAELLKVFGDKTRAKIMCALSVRPLFVGEIAQLLDMSLSAVSHQLRILRAAKLVKSDKKGKEVLYSLDDDHVMQIINFGLTHVCEND